MDVAKFEELLDTAISKVMLEAKAEGVTFNVDAQTSAFMMATAVQLAKKNGMSKKSVEVLLDTVLEKAFTPTNA